MSTHRADTRTAGAGDGASRPHRREGDTQMDTTRLAGRIQRLNETYGFIRDEDGRDYFFLPKELRGMEFGQLKTGQAVEFDPVEHERGMRAENVEVRS